MSVFPLHTGFRLIRGPFNTGLLYSTINRTSTMTLLLILGNQKITLQEGGIHIA
jgi:hypothetical protein